jgi:hypothetical protein
MSQALRSSPNTERHLSPSPIVCSWGFEGRARLAMVSECAVYIVLGPSAPAQQANERFVGRSLAFRGIKEFV